MRQVLCLVGRQISRSAEAQRMPPRLPSLARKQAHPSPNRIALQETNICAQLTGGLLTLNKRLERLTNQANRRLTGGRKAPGRRPVERNVRQRNRASTRRMLYRSEHRNVGRVHCCYDFREMRRARQNAKTPMRNAIAP